MNRTIPDYKEPSSRITSTVPINQCIYNQDLSLQFPGSTVGECFCAFAYAGESCDSIAITYNKFSGESLACGGVGLANIQITDTITSRDGLDAGSIVEYDDCITIDLGTVGYTTLTGFIWEYASVYIDNPPIDGQPLFINYINTTTFSQAYSLCFTDSSFLAYFNTPDELNQMIQYQPPFFIDANVTSSNVLPWIDFPTNYFINGQTITSGSDIGNYNCISNQQFCQAINAQNYFYNINSYNCLQDGNTVTSCTNTTSPIQYSSTAPLQVQVVIYGSTISSLSCSSGVCSLSSSTSQTNHPSSFVTTFNCRCPNRDVIIPGSGSFTEIQVFGSSFRNSLY